jgi:uncharacterized protein
MLSVERSRAAVTGDRSARECSTLTVEQQFEWDAAKQAQNLEKHRIAFPEAITVFDDPMFITVVDDEHSEDEERYLTIGLSAQGQLLLVAHTERAHRIRIISARRATKKEEQFYAEAE